MSKFYPPQRMNKKNRGRLYRAQLALGRIARTLDNDDLSDSEAIEVIADIVTDWEELRYGAREPSEAEAS
ncbi:hypothetical protein ACAG26_24165 [Mycobacterium sp. pUA109]|uniref:hypothetical protein n=1 Tax=Mycobacterium sp. pUA109 TaxID=3238982 RepID=UPI00351B0AC0